MRGGNTGRVNGGVASDVQRTPIRFSEKKCPTCKEGANVASDVIDLISTAEKSSLD